VKGRVAHLLIDYFRRTLGVWLLLALLQLMQTVAFWASKIERAPALGVVLASLVYFAAFESPYTVLRILPLTRADIAKFRWWASVGSPGLVILACTAVSRLASFDNDWPRPSDSSIVLLAAFSIAVLGWLAALPLPVLKPDGKGRARFAFVWGSLVAAAFYGLPFGSLPRPILMTLIALGLLLIATSYIRARGGLLTKLSLPDVSPRREQKGQGASARMGMLRGWTVLAVEVARSTALLSVVALAGASIVRASVARWLYPAIEGALVWVFVSAVAVATSFLTQRWMHAVRSMRLLPIGEHRLALILYFVLMTPGLVACLVAMGVHQLSPHWGLGIPLYMLVVFLVTPITLVPWQQRYTNAPVAHVVQQWAPLMQQAAWPLWAGALCAFGGPRLMPAWFLAFLLLIAIGLSIGGYVALLAGIRSPAGFDRNGGPLGVAS
jgi:hypothetical protein